MEIKWKEFVRSLTAEDFTNLQREVWSRKYDDAEAEAEAITMTSVEAALVNSGDKIGAIRAVRNRNSVSLLVAKTVVDNYLSRCKNCSR